ncbi:DUF262 domain-containing protein [Aerococcus loyolae]|uniref:DUF262 domain-containing HNH endonuclease family protein n=1 Tax=Aerococcus loyolae TaxID=2976809 RepID=A0ABT4BZS6_9LACT|nr:DUF262 domain-containing protein [Aerococcus loyolae]MCY3024933.1 DUF262 domain-containing HNH endonuclease family protein [Aerococcus loyolae]MCY3027011.1 DUF262 domain-containing HNH endonuclease family protein [Aerococcus loyolae]MCY3028595.1 DUF262 domain-containing HNH endonuclease family protein [Aerococcus loyolae]OAM70549.1 hypothetical protein A1D21_02790 [Aerococcus loyolae]
MDGSIQNLANFLKRSSKIIIPVYQRNYDWKLDNCKRLFSDLMAIHEEKRRTHFFGSIVVKPGTLIDETIVIDGQQRITTVSLLFLALCNWMDDNNVSDGAFTSENIRDEYLVNRLSNEGDKYKLRLNIEDDKIYKVLLTDPKHAERAVDVGNTNVLDNYNYFYQQVDQTSLSIVDLIQVISRLEVMGVNLSSPDDDAQLIFESLNSTGVDLTEADKIRNFLLMNENQEDQNRYFTTYWHPIEKRTQYDLSLFFWYYMAIKQGKYPVKSRLYEDFKTFYEKNFTDKETFFKEINDYSYAFQEVITANTGNHAIDDILFRLNQIDLTVMRPFLMSLVLAYNKGDLLENEAVAMLELIESFTARHIIIKSSTSLFNKFYSSLYRDFKRLYDKAKEEGQEVEKVEVLGALLINKSKNLAFPKDEEVLADLRMRDFYNIRPNYRTYLFERLENYNHHEILNIYQGIEEGNYSIEHIMPQKLSKDWIQELGPNYKEIHESYLNRLGNLTITGYNSKYSNKTFQMKKTMDKGFNESHFVYLNALPREVDHWNEETIKERTRLLADKALEVWPYPEVDFEIKEDNQDGLETYDGEKDYRSYKIKGYIFRDQEYRPVKRWNTFLVEVLQELAHLDYKTLYQIAEEQKSRGWQTRLSINNDMYDPVTKDIYVDTGINNWNKMNIIRHLFDIYGIEYSELQVDVRPPKK